MKHSKPHLALALIGLLLPMLVVAQGSDDQWAVTMKMSMTKPMPMDLPVQTHQSCVPANTDVLAPPTDKATDCRVEKMEKEDQRVSFRISCNMQGARMTGEGWAEHSDADSYRGEFSVEGEAEGMPMAMTMSYSGKRTGRCTATRD